MSTDEEEIMEWVLEELKEDGIEDTAEARLLYLEIFRMVSTNALGLVDQEDVDNFRTLEEPINVLIAKEQANLSDRGKGIFRVN